MLDEIYLKRISATIMQGVANKPIGVQMYTITGSSDHYVAVYCATHQKQFHIINHSCLFAFMATVANSEV